MSSNRIPAAPAVAPTAPPGPVRRIADRDEPTQQERPEKHSQRPPRDDDPDSPSRSHIDEYA